MASDGLLNKAAKGTCRMCLRVRCTNKHVHSVGEVRHGFATGHIWECNDVGDCEKTIGKKLSNSGEHVRVKITRAIEFGRFKEYHIFA